MDDVIFAARVPQSTGFLAVAAESFARCFALIRRTGLRSPLKYSLTKPRWSQHCSFEDLPQSQERAMPLNPRSSAGYGGIRRRVSIVGLLHILTPASIAVRQARCNSRFTDH